VSRTSPRENRSPRRSIAQKRAVTGWLRGEPDHYRTNSDAGAKMMPSVQTVSREGWCAKPRIGDEQRAAWCPSVSKTSSMLREAPEHLSMLCTPEGGPSSANYNSRAPSRHRATAIWPTPPRIVAVASGWSGCRHRTPGKRHLATARTRFGNSRGTPKLLGHLARLRPIDPQGSRFIVGHSAFPSSPRTSGSPNA
jgi:hypothetical protein